MSNYNAEMVAYWNRIIREKRDFYRKHVTDPALFSRLAALPKALKILDAGCGEGYVTRWLPRQGNDVTAIDVSTQMLFSAAKYGIAKERYLATDITNLCFKNASFDCVVSNFVLMEIEHLEKAFFEISRVIKPGGKFIFQILHPLYSFSLVQKIKTSDVPKDYFNSEKISKKYSVDGLESPFSVSWYHKTFRKIYTALRRKSLPNWRPHRT